VIGFGVNKTGYSIYSMSTTILNIFSEELKDYRFEKSTLHIRENQRIPTPVLKKIIKLRYKLNEERSAARKK
jgi:uncharacterized protein YdhG (YjbR/CyaY superfamily)